jgi:ABC-2 type transport system ATP-binding protein
MAQMRHLSALIVQVTFDDRVPDLSGVAGVSMVEVEGRTLTCQVKGPVEPLLQVLAGAGVHELLSREPSLEELFLSHYGPGSPREASGDAH